MVLEGDHSKGGRLGAREPQVVKRKNVMARHR
jgi:hypothetical protein